MEKIQVNVGDFSKKSQGFPKNLYLDKLKDEKVFFCEMRFHLSKAGFNLAFHEVKGLYTVSTQLFHRLWWDWNIGKCYLPRKVYQKSKLTMFRYTKSRQGTGFSDLLIIYHELKSWQDKKSQIHMTFLDKIRESLKKEIIFSSLAILDNLDLNHSDQIGAIVKLIIDQLRTHYPNVGLVETTIKKIKKMSRHYHSQKDKEKQLLKKKSIFQITIPMIWEMLLDEFRNNPLFFYPSLQVKKINRGGL